MATQMPPAGPRPSEPPEPAARASSDVALTAAPSNIRILAAEIVGTAILMIGGPGSAVLAADQYGPPSPPMMLPGRRREQGAAKAPSPAPRVAEGPFAALVAFRR